MCRRIQDKVSNIEPHIGYDQAALSDVRFESQGDDVKNDLIDDNIPVRDVPNPAPEEAPVHDMVDDEGKIFLQFTFDKNLGIL